MNTPLNKLNLDYLICHKSIQMLGLVRAKPFINLNNHFISKNDYY